MFVSRFGKRRGPKLKPGEMREQIAELRAAGLTYAAIAARLEVTKSTVAYHARRLGVPADDKCARRYDWRSIQEAYDTGLSARACAARFGFNLASWHAAKLRGDIRPRPRRMPLEDLLVEDRPQTNRSHLKQRLLAEGVKENRCEQCGLTAWNGEPVNIQLHHRNGKGKDNRLENIIFLCANCHAQTPNWGGRNRNRHRGLEPVADPLSESDLAEAAAA